MKGKEKHLQDDGNEVAEIKRQKECHFTHCTFLGGLLERMNNSHKEYNVSQVMKLLCHNTLENSCCFAYLAILLPLISTEKGG